MKRIVIVKFITLFCDQQRVRKLRKYSNEIKKKNCVFISGWC